MFRTRVKAALLGAVLSLAGVIGGAGSAQAAVYSGHWDPAYGPAFPGLGWMGTATFYIPDECLSSSGWVSNGDSCSGGGMKFLGATITFYDLSTSVAVENLTLDPLALPSSFIYSMQVTDGALTGVSSGFSSPVQAFSTLAGGGSYFFDLAFFQGDANGNGKGASLFYTTGNQNPLCAFYSPGSCGYSQTTPSVTYAPIPEPETYSLMLAGLGAIGFIGWRRRR